MGLSRSESGTAVADSFVADIGAFSKLHPVQVSVVAPRTAFAALKDIASAPARCRMGVTLPLDGTREVLAEAGCCLTDLTGSKADNPRLRSLERSVPPPNNSCPARVRADQPGLRCRTVPGSTTWNVVTGLGAPCAVS
jgi:hypothetical protein